MSGTVKTLIESNIQLNSKAIAGSIFSAGEVAGTARKTQWEKLVFLFTSHTIESKDDLSEYLTENMSEEFATKAPMDKKGERFLFRQWSVTKPLWQYATYIQRLIDSGDTIESIFPLDETIPSSNQIKERAYGLNKKSDKTDYQKVSALLTTVSQIVGKIENLEEKRAVLTLISSITDQLNQ